MKKSIELLQIALKSKLAGKIKSFYTGDPHILPESVMPCIIVNPVRTDTEVADNARDVHTHSIAVSLVIDARQYFNATPDKMVGTDFLMTTMEGETSAGAIDSNSILGVLRENLTLDTNRSIGNISSVDYTTRQRTEDLITLEAVVSLDISYIVTR